MLTSCADLFIDEAHGDSDYPKQPSAFVAGRRFARRAAPAHMSDEELEAPDYLQPMCPYKGSAVSLALSDGVVTDGGVLSEAAVRRVWSTHALVTDSAVEHCSSVLQEMGYGDMLSESLSQSHHYHGT